MPEQDRLEVLEEQLAEDGFAPETLRALELILEELHYLRDELGDVHASSRTCRSTTPSHGAVAESERLFAAADAGPRQPHKHECGIDFKHEVCACVDCGATKPIERPWNEADATPRWDEICANCGSVYGSHFGTKCPKPHQTYWASAPPVPQEAAPRECDCEECASRLATATDWAMRVAREIKSMLVRWIDYEDTQYVDPVPIAALIREAGSERERAIPPIEYQHDIAKNIAKQHNFDPRDASFARCVGAIMQAWRAGGE